MIRAVLDTNAIISALLFDGPASRLVPAWQHRRFVLLVSQALLAECVRVLHYPKFRLGPEAIRRLVEQELLPFIAPVKVTRVPRAIRADPADNHALACAVAGHAEVIVSGDHHLLDLGKYRGVSIITVSAFLQYLPLLP